MPSATDLCALADVKGWLSIAATTTSDDALLGRLITATSTDFLAEIGRYDFFAADYTEARRGVALENVPLRVSSPYLVSHDLILRHWPVNSIASLVLDGATITASPDGIQSGYWLDPNTDPESKNIVKLIDYVFTKLSELTITYNAGYTSAPADVTQAVIEWVAARYRSRQSLGMASQRLVEGRSQSEEAAYVPWDMPKSTQRVVERYRSGTVSTMFSSHD